MPPSRSSASFGVHEPPPQIHAGRVDPKSTAMMTPSQVSDARPSGRGSAWMTTWMVSHVFCLLCGSRARSAARAEPRSSGVVSRPTSWRRASSSAGRVGRRARRTRGSPPRAPRPRRAVLGDGATAASGSTTRAIVWRCTLSTVPGAVSTSDLVRRLRRSRGSCRTGRSWSSPRRPGPDLRLQLCALRACRLRELRNMKKISTARTASMMIVNGSNVHEGREPSDGARVAARSQDGG